MLIPPGSPVAQTILNGSFRTDKPDTVINVGEAPPHIGIDMDILNEHIPAEQQTQLPPSTANVLEELAIEIDGLIDEINTADGGNDILKFVNNITSQIRNTEPPVDTILGIPNLDMFEGSSHSQPSDTFMQRAQTIINHLGELLGKLTRNEFEGDLGRWASNLTISGLRTGLVTATLTVVRQMIGFALEKALQSTATTALTRSVIGAVVQSIGPLLNVLGAIRDEYNDTATKETRAARSVTLILSLIAITAAATVPAALPALASFGSQMLFYTFAQDLVSLFCPTGDNAKASPSGTAVAGLLNGMLQFLSFTGMNYTAPHSGPGYVMAQGNQPLPPESEGLASQLANWCEKHKTNPNLPPEAQAEQILDSLTLELGHDITRGGLNATADILGQVFLGEAGHALQEKPSENGFRINPITFRIPTPEQAANQLLSTNAIRTSVGQIIMGVVISATRYFSTLPIPKEVVDHIANLLVAAVVFAARPGTGYVNARSTPE